MEKQENHNKEMGAEKNPGENSNIEDNSHVTNEDLEGKICHKQSK